MQTIAGIATALLQATQPEWKAYAKQVIENARALADTLVTKGYKLQTNGTDNHLVLWDLRPLGLTGSKLEKLCDLLGITINKNAVAGDTSAQVPGGMRLGTSALTSRDMLESDVRQVGEFLHRAVQIALHIQKETGSKLLKDFVAAATKGDVAKQVHELRREVAAFAKRWPLPGIDTSKLTRPAGIEEDE
jgi:glycine hydroxymethyltransferase